MTRICIVTINFNSEKETHQLLASLNHIDTKGLEITVVVVDNGSKNPFQLTNLEKKEGVCLIKTAENLGFTGGSNEGICFGMRQGADYILLINNDTIVDPHLLQELLKPFSNDSSIGVVVPKIYFAKGHEYHRERYKKEELGNIFWYAGGFVDWQNVFTKHRGVDEVDKGQYNKAEAVDFATGCCVLIKREVIERVGMFDTKYYLYFEDGDLSQRVLKKGYTIMYNPKAVLWHITAASGGGSGSPLHDYYLSRNRMLFGVKYAPFRSKVALARESLRLLLQGRLWQKKGIQDFYLGKLGRGSYR